jgi:hypothetical protein
LTEQFKGVIDTFQTRFSKFCPKVDLTGRTRVTYGYRWDLCEKVFSDSFAQASRLRVSEAHEQIFSHLNRNVAEVTMERAAGLFRW